MQEQSTQPSRPWEHLRSVLETDVDLAVYPTIKLPDGTDGWFVGARGSSPGAPDDGSFDRAIQERYGESLEIADGCQPIIGEDGSVSFRGNPSAISYAIRQTPRIMNEASISPDAREESKQGLRQWPIVRWLIERRS